MGAALGAAPKHAPGTLPCPASPAAAVSVPTGAAQNCPALEVGGQIAGSGPVLGAAFTVTVPAAQLARPGRSGVTTLSGFAADGRQVFSLPLDATGDFRVYVPLAPGALAALTRLQLASGAAVTERDATAHGEPQAEIVSLDPDTLLIAWNAREFPALRVLSAGPGAAQLTEANGSSTYEELTVGTQARAVVLQFSDGVRSVDRTYSVPGR
jgi:hypothetical protein